jgi:FkbM family methyltransferase
MARNLRHLLQRGMQRIGLHVERMRDPFDDQKLLLGKPGANIIFDCGANVGRTALSYRKLFPTARIYSFEPSATLHEQLIRNTAAAGNVEAVRMGVSDESGESQFFEYNITGYNSMAHCTVPGIKVVSECTVPVCTIDRFCAENKIEMVDILKLDIQGSELKALHGARSMLEKQKISLIFSEVLFGPEYEQQAYYHEIAGWLARFGYQLFRFYELRYASDRSLDYSDAIFCTEPIFRSGLLRSAR